MLTDFCRVIPTNCLILVSMKTIYHDGDWHNILIVRGDVDNNCRNANCSMIYHHGVSECMYVGKEAAV